MQFKSERFNKIAKMGWICVRPSRIATSLAIVTTGSNISQTQDTEVMFLRLVRPITSILIAIEAESYV